MNSLLSDLRIALRSIVRTPLLAFVAAASLTIGIGANTVLFSAVNRLLLRSPGGIESVDRVVEIGFGPGFGSWSYPDLLDVRAGATPLEEVAGYSMEPMSLSRGEEGVRVLGFLVSANYFRTLGVSPGAGRLFLPHEDLTPGEPAVAVLGHDFWMSRFGGDPAVVGSSVTLNRQSFTVVGVTPPDFRGHVVAMYPDVYLPLMAYPLVGGNAEAFDRRNWHWFQVLGRLRPNAPLEQGRAAVGAVFARMAAENPDSYAARGTSLEPLGALPGAAMGPVRIFLLALSGLVLSILLITCANVAGMFLARAGARRREMAVRLSLGSSRGRMVQHLLVESSVVFLLGGAGGVLLARWGLDLLSGVELPAPFPVDLSLALDLRVLVFACLLTLGTGLVFGLLPALQATRLDLAATLKEGGMRGGSPANRLRQSFVSGQVGLSLMLLVAAGLFLRSLQQAGQVETGFDPRGTVSTWLDLSMEGYDPEEGKVFASEMVRRLSGEPWVGSAAFASDLPLDMGNRGTAVHPEGRNPDDLEARVPVDFNQITPEYFSTLRIPVLEGRAFQETDGPDSEPVVVVSRRFVQEVWPGESPVGRTVTLDGTTHTIVGVVEDTKNTLLTDAPKPFVYFPLAQSYGGEVNLVVRSRQPHAVVAPELRRVLLEQDPSLSLGAVVDMVSYTSVGVLPQRLAAWLTTLLGGLALLLSGMGIYGVVAHSVAQRTREIGVRMALGAEGRGVVRLVMADGMRLAAPGLAVGALLALGLGRVLRSLLLGVSPADPATLAGVALVLVGMILVATLVPARRAAGVHPAEALRYD